MSNIARWYVATTTKAGYLRFGCRVMYMRRAWGKVSIMHQKSIQLIETQEARELFNSPTLVPPHLQSTLNDLWRILNTQ